MFDLNLYLDCGGVEEGTDRVYAQVLVEQGGGVLLEGRTLTPGPGLSSQ